MCGYPNAYAMDNHIYFVLCNTNVVLSYLLVVTSYINIMTDGVGG